MDRRARRELERALGQGPVCKPNRRAVRRYYPQRRYRQGSPARPHWPKYDEPQASSSEATAPREPEVEPADAKAEAVQPAADSAHEAGTCRRTAAAYDRPHGSPRRALQMAVRRSEARRVWLLRPQRRGAILRCSHERRLPSGSSPAEMTLLSALGFDRGQGRATKLESQDSRRFSRTELQGGRRRRESCIVPAAATY